MPAAVFFWFFGWSLYWIESKREETISKTKLSEEKELKLFVPIPQQEYTTSPRHR
jgi:hypothetical protein